MQRLVGPQGASLRPGLLPAVVSREKSLPRARRTESVFFVRNRSAAAGFRAAHGPISCGGYSSLRVRSADGGIDPTLSRE